MESSSFRMAVNYLLQDKFLQAFFSSRFGPDFYLTGGTALARFYFHHRESVDLDLFTQNKQVDFNELNITISQFASDLRLTPQKTVVTDTFLQYIYTEGLKIDFVKDIPVHFGDFKQDGIIRLDSLENIGSNKILAIFGRLAIKDFIDLYFLLQETDFSFDHFYNLATKKDLGLTEFYLANSVDRVDEAGEYPTLLKPLDKTKMRKFYKDLAQQLLLKIKPK